MSIVLDENGKSLRLTRKGLELLGLSEPEIDTYEQQTKEQESHDPN
jgi:hypothetical protein